MISVLYVDDEEALLDITRIFLEKEGIFKVDTASSAKIALEKIKKKSYDAVVSDFQMPEMDGVELLKAVRTAYPDLPFIIFTGKGREEIAIQAFESGADYYLQKGGDPRSQYAELRHKILRAVERRQSLESLFEEKRFLRVLIDSLPLAVFAKDIEGRFVAWNKKSEELFGFRAEDVLQKTDFDIFPEEQAVFFREKDAEAIGSGKIEDIPLEPIDLQNGERRYLHTRKLPLFNEKGVPFAILGISEDITEKIGRDEALKETEARYRRLFEAAKDGILIVNGDTLKIIDANPYIRELLGVGTDELLGRHIREIELLKDRIIVEELQKEGHVRCDDLLLERKDGTKVYVELICYLYVVNSRNIIQCNIRDISKRKKDEAMLRESEENFRAFFETSRDCAFITSIDGRWIDLNDAAVALFGYESKEELRKVPIPKLYKNVGDRQKHLKQIEREGFSRDCPIDLKKKDGSIIHTRITSVPKTDEQGAVIGYRGIIRDVTEQKQAEEALRESERELKMLFKSMINAFVLFESVFDEGGNFISYRFVFINDAYERITGVKNDEVRGKTVHEVWPGTEESWVKAYGQVAVTGVPSTFDMYHEPTKKFYHCNVYRSGDSPDRFCVIFEDITERKKAEEELNFKNILLSVQQEASIDGILIIDREGNAVSCNRQFIGMWDLPGDVINVGSNNLVLKSVLEKIVDPESLLEQVRYLHEHPADTSRDEIVLKDSRTFDSYTAPMIGSDGTYYGRVWYFRDITDRKRLEDALVLAAKKINLLSSITRHDIINQITVLSTALELIKSSTSDPEILDLVDTGMKAAMTINRQITFTREYQDLGVKAPRWQNVRRTFLDAAEYLETGDIRIDTPEDNLEIYADPLLYKVFYNLIDNALRYAAPFSTIGLSYQESGARMVICIRDDGAGISPKDKEHLFERGFGRNTGLGLFLSREILAITGIAISENGAPGSGARFEIAVPKGGYRFQTAPEK